jgi:hypothetical protein
LYLLGAEMLECFPHAPLLDNMGLTIGVLSYNGRMCFGFNADYDRIPDLTDFVTLMRRSFERLFDVAGARRRKAAAPARAKPRKQRPPTPAPVPMVEEVPQQPIPR